MRTLERDDRARERTLEPIQLVKLTTFADATNIGSVTTDLVTGSSLTGWAGITDGNTGQQGLVYDTTQFTPNNAYRWGHTQGVTFSGYDVTLAPADVAKIMLDGFLNLRIALQTPTDFDVFRVQLFVNGKGSAEKTWDVPNLAILSPTTLFNVSLALTDANGPPGNDLPNVDRIRFRFSRTITGALRNVWVADPVSHVSPRENIGASQSFYFSSRQIVYRYDQSTPLYFDPRLQTLSAFATAMSHIPEPTVSGSLQKQLTATLQNEPALPGESSLFEQLFDKYGVQFAELEVSELLADPGSSLDQLAALPAYSHDTYFRGVVRGLDQVDENTLRVVADTNLDPPDFDWPGGAVLDDATQADPRDLGKRFDVPLGVAKDIPLLGVDVPWYTTLAEPMDASQTFVALTDATGFPATGSAGYRVLISNEVIEYGVGATKVGNTLQGITRGVQEGKNVEESQHALGESVIELGTDTTLWTWGGLEVGDQLTDIRIRNGIANDILVAATQTRWFDVDGKSVQISGLVLRQELQDLVTQGNALTQQPSTSNRPDLTLTQYPTSVARFGPDSGGGQSNAAALTALTDGSGTPNDPPNSTNTTRMGNLDNSSAANGGANGYELNFASVSNVNSITLQVYMNPQLESSNVTLARSFFPVLQVRKGGQGSIIAGTLQRSSGGERWYSFSMDPTSNVHTIEWDDNFNGNQFWGNIYQVRRIVNYRQPGGGNDITTEAAAAVSVGEGLQLFATATMRTKTTGDATANLYPNTAVGAPVESFPDVLRFILQQGSLVDARFVSEGGQLDDATWQIADQFLGATKVSGLLSSLGDSPEQALSRLCWEFGANLTYHETNTRPTIRLHVPQRVQAAPREARYLWPSPSATITEWDAISAKTRDGRELYNSDTPYLYNTQLPRQLGDVEGFQSLYTTFGLEGTEGQPFALASTYRVGKRTGDGLFGFITIDDDASALYAAGYYHQEGARDYAQEIALAGVPWWEAMSVEEGDVVLIDSPPWVSSGRVFDRLDRGLLDPAGVYGRVCSGAISPQFGVAWDLSLVDRIAFEFQVGPTSWGTAFTAILSNAISPTDSSEWDFTVPATPNVWHRVELDVTSPTRTNGAGADRARIGNLRIDAATAPGSGELFYITRARYASERFLKARATQVRKNWGPAGSTIDLVCVEVD